MLFTSTPVHKPNPTTKNFVLEGSCAAHGTCERDLGRELGYRCRCEPEWEGPRCANRKPSTPLLNGLFDVQPVRHKMEAKGRMLIMDNATILSKNNVADSAAPEVVSFNKVKNNAKSFTADSLILYLVG